MKKLLVILAAVALVWAFAVPASAVDWNFYGSARMATFYTSEDGGDFLVTSTDDSDDGVQWALQSNSRIGATVKGDAVDGRVELALKGSSTGDVDVGTRRIFGTWDFGAGKLKVGKDYTPVSQCISGQVFDGDLGLLGVGTQYGNRTGQIALSFGGFTIALIDPNGVNIAGFGGALGDVDEFLPKIEASWGMSFDAFSFAIQGGYQYYEVEDVPSIVSAGATLEDVTVDAWTIGGNAGFNFGPAYVKGAVSYGQNIGAAAWGIPGLRTATGALPFYDGDDDLEDINTLMAALVVGFKMSDMVSFEGGFGYRVDEPDTSGLQDDDVWEVYVQSVIVLAPGVYVIPEVGYTDFMDPVVDIAGADDEGNRFYLGAKWQIDF
jgi:hypothetical protein